MEEGRASEGARRAQAHARDDRSADSAHARCLRRLLARRRGRRLGYGRRRHDLRDRLCAIPRRPHALRAHARRGRDPADAVAILAALRRALPARSGLEPSDLMRSGGGPTRFDDADRAADAIIARVGKKIVLGLPLGLGKANHVANTLFARAAADPSIHLRIFTALTLEKPRAEGELERRFVAPFAERVFGGYPDLAYAIALHAGTLPSNIEVDEFFFQAGSRLWVA